MSITPEEGCGEIVHKEERVRQSFDECGMLRYRRGK